MITLTPEQYKSKYGNSAAWTPQAASSLGRPTISQVLANPIIAGAKNVGNITKGIVDEFKQGGQNIIDNVRTTSTSLDYNPQEKQNIGTTVLNTVGQVAKTTFAPFTEILKTAGQDISKSTPDNIKKPVSNVVSSVSNTFQPLIQKYNDIATNHPELAKDFENAINVAMLLGGKKVEPSVVGSAEKTLNTTAEATKAGLNTVKTGINDAIDSGLTKTKNALDSITENTAKYPKQIADKITMGKIDTKVQTILKESPATTFDKYVKQGEKALIDPRQITPLELAGQSGEDVAKVIKKDLNNIGEQKSLALESVKDTRVPNIATEQIQKIKPLLQKKLTDSERGIVNEYVTELKSLGKNPTAGSIDATIDKLQSTIYEKSKGVAIPMTTRVKSFINSSIGELNGKLKTAVDTALGNDSYSSLNAKYADKIKMFGTLNKALGEGGTKGGSLMKKFFSPQDAGTKELFAAIKEQYGVDLGADATLAKFVMDTLGDTRARSLLQLPPTTPMGMVGKALDYVEGKLTSPTKVIQKARTITKP